MLEANQIVEDLRQLGVTPEDTIVVHSSYNALRGNDEIEGGPEAVIEALKQTVSEGNLLLPALSYLNVNLDNRVFDLVHSESCIGVLPETMRLSKGVYRSIHPTHSVCAWGKDSQEIVKNHEKDFTPVGPNSPFREVRRRNGKIIMLGCDPRRNTSMHGVEEMVAAPYLFRGNYDYDIILPDRRFRMEVLRHKFDDYAQRYDRILNVLDTSDYQQGKVLHGDCFVMNAEAVWRKGLEKIKEDTYYFVDEIPLEKRVIKRH